MIMDKDRPRRLILVDLYEGKVQRSFDNADQLVTYLKERNEAGTLRGEAAYNLFWGNQLSTNRFWKSAFSKKEVSTP